MKRKSISCVLVASLLFSTGCYNTNVLTKDELKANSAKVDITVYTNDSREYNFSGESYSVQGDSLSGFKTVQSNSNRFVRDRSVTIIALADINSIETSEFSVVRTLVNLGLVTVAGGVLFLLLGGARAH